MKKIISMFTLPVLLLLLNGCISAEYSGQKFAATDPGFPIQFYNTQDDVPSDKYNTVGRLVVEGPGDCTNEVLRETILDKAHAYGVDAVVVTKVRREELAAVYVPERGRRPTGSWGTTGLDGAGNQVYVDTFGNPTSLNPPRTNRYKIVVDVHFLMDKARHAKELAAYEKDREAKGEVREKSKDDQQKIDRGQLLENAARKAEEDARIATKDQPGTLKPDAAK